MLLYAVIFMWLSKLQIMLLICITSMHYWDKLNSSIEIRYYMSQMLYIEIKLLKTSDIQLECSLAKNNHSNTWIRYYI